MSIRISELRQGFSYGPADDDKSNLKGVPIGAKSRPSISLPYARRSRHLSRQYTAILVWYGYQQGMVVYKFGWKREIRYLLTYPILQMYRTIVSLEEDLCREKWDRQISSCYYRCGAYLSRLGTHSLLFTFTSSSVKYQSEEQRQKKIHTWEVKANTWCIGLSCDPLYAISDDFASSQNCFPRATTCPIVEIVYKSQHALAGIFLSRDTASVLVWISPHPVLTPREY